MEDKSNKFLMPQRKPQEPAAQYRVGTKKTGNDGNIYVVKKSADQKTWIRVSGEIPKSAPNLIVKNGKIMQFSAPSITRRVYFGWVNCPNGLSAGEFQRKKIKSMKPGKYHMHWVDGCLIAAKRFLCNSDILKVIWKYAGKALSERGTIGLWYSGYNGHTATLNDPQMKTGSMVIGKGATIGAVTRTRGTGYFAIYTDEKKSMVMILSDEMQRELHPHN